MVQQTVLGYSVSPAADVTSKHCLVDSGEDEHCADTGPFRWMKADMYKPGLTLEKLTQWVWMGGGHRAQPSVGVGGFYSVPQPGLVPMVALNSGQEPPLPWLCAGWASMQKASAPGGFSLDLNCQAGLAEVPGSPLVTVTRCGAPQGFNNEMIPH